MTNILDAVTFVVEPGYLDDFEFQTRIGLNRTELGQILRFLEAGGIPDFRMAEEFAIVNCLNEVVHGDIPLPRVWREQFTNELGSVGDTLAKIAQIPVPKEE